MLNTDRSSCVGECLAAGLGHIADLHIAYQELWMRTVRGSEGGIQTYDRFTVNSGFENWSQDRGMNLA